MKGERLILTKLIQTIVRLQLVKWQKCLFGRMGLILPIKSGGVSLPGSYANE